METEKFDPRSHIDLKPNFEFNFRLELCRLQSFEHWPSNAAVKAKDLANAGFYYMGTDDRVQCAFCRGILRNWEQEDQSLVEHRRHFPACPFLDDRASVGNIPLEEENESVCTTIDMREGDDETARDVSFTDSILFIKVLGVFVLSLSCCVRTLGFVFACNILNYFA